MAPRPGALGGYDDCGIGRVDSRFTQSSLGSVGDETGMGDMDLSAATLFAGLVVSGIGFAVYRYGKSEAQFVQILTGLAMMVCPMFVPGAIANYAVGALLLGLMWATGRFIE